MIREADKGSAVVNMDIWRYIKEGLRQLNNRDVDTPFTADPTTEHCGEVRALLSRLCNQSVITEDMALDAFFVTFFGVSRH